MTTTKEYNLILHSGLFITNGSASACIPGVLAYVCMLLSDSGNYQNLISDFSGSQSANNVVSHTKVSWWSCQYRTKCTKNLRRDPCPPLLLLASEASEAYSPALCKSFDIRVSYCTAHALIVFENKTSQGLHLHQAHFLVDTYLLCRYLNGIWATIACQFLTLLLTAMTSLTFIRRNRLAREGKLDSLEGQSGFFYTI
jgi:hypothetical protein